MKVLSRFASPAGFALVLLLFFLMPFISVSCEVPGYGVAGASYTGSHLVSGIDPEVPDELKKLSDDPESPAALTDPPDPGVQVLAIALAVLAVGGVLTVLIPHLKARLFSGAAVAGVTLVVTVVTMMVAESHLRSALVDWATRTGVAETQDGLPELESAVGEVIHTEVGYWLMVVLLALNAVMAATLGLFGDRLAAILSSRSTGGGGGGGGRLGALSFGTTDTSSRKKRPRR